MLIPRKGKDGEVVLSKAVAVLGFSLLVMSLALAYFRLFAEGAVVYGAGALVVSLISMALVVSFINCRITYDAEGFTAGNFLASNGNIHMPILPRSRKILMRLTFMPVAKE